MLNLYAGVSESDSGFEEICREPSEGFIAPERRLAAAAATASTTRLRCARAQVGGAHSARPPVRVHTVV